MIIETRLTRPGETTKPSVGDEFTDVVLDFDVFGHDMPSTIEWRAWCKENSLSPNQTLYITEARSVFCSPRLAWMLTQSGFEHVQLIRPSNIDQSKNTQNVFNDSVLDTIEVSGFVGQQEVQYAQKNGGQIIDVRSLSRFTGEEADPRPHVRSGHIPGSTHIHYGQFLAKNESDVFLPQPLLRDVFSSAQIDLAQPIIFSCGSGVTACIGAIAATLCGAKNVSVYDGSWAEWGADHSLPIATGKTE